MLTTLILGSAAAWWRYSEQSDRQRATAARERETERGATEALAEAKTLLTEGDKQLDNPARWQATVKLAESAVKRAENVLATGVPTEELELRVQRVREAVDAALTDSNVLVELDRIQLDLAALGKDGNYDQKGAAARTEAVLRSYGVDLAVPSAAAARINGSRLREALLAALDDMWWGMSGTKNDSAQKQRVEAVRLAAEPAPDAFRARWRAAVRRRDRIALERMAGEPGVQDLPPAAVINLAIDLDAVWEGGLVQKFTFAASERLLRACQERYPGNFWLNYRLGYLELFQIPARPEEALRYLTAALALRSDSPDVYVQIARILITKGDLEGAIRHCHAAHRFNPKYAGAHSELARALQKKGDLKGAMAVLLSNPKCRCNNLGEALLAKGDFEAAIVCFQADMKNFPNDRFSGVHTGLGDALRGKGDIDGAIRCYRTALQIEPNFPWSVRTRSNLGIALMAKGDIEGAISEYQAVLDKYPKNALVHNNLGNALRDKGDIQGAIREYQAALKIDPKYAFAHFNLGVALYAKGDLEGAIREYQAGLQINPKNALAQSNLGNAQKAKALGRNAERLSKILKGESQPADAAERLGLAWLCIQPYKQLNAAAVRFYAEAFAAEPKLADDLGAAHRYDAACAAALAGCGQGKDAPAKEPERARLRRQALDWLRADLTAYRQQLDKDAAKARPTVLKKMQHWQRDRDFAGVRGPEALARLPESERPEWQKLWQEVAAHQQRASQAQQVALPKNELKQISALARQGKHDEAVKQAMELAGKVEHSGAFLHEWARVYALSAAAVKAQTKLHDFYTGTATELLRQALLEGHGDAAKLRDDNDFRELRPLGDFQRLLADMQAKTGPTPGTEKPR